MNSYQQLQPLDGNVFFWKLCDFRMIRTFNVLATWSGGHSGGFGIGNSLWAWGRRNHMANRNVQKKLCFTGMDNTDRVIGVYLIMFAVVAIQRWVLEILFLSSCTSRMSKQNPEQAPTRRSFRDSLKATPKTAKRKRCLFYILKIVKKGYILVVCLEKIANIVEFDFLMVNSRTYRSCSTNVWPWRFMCIKRRMSTYYIYGLLSHWNITGSFNKIWFGTQLAQFKTGWLCPTLGCFHRLGARQSKQKQTYFFPRNVRVAWFAVIREQTPWTWAG